MVDVAYIVIVKQHIPSVEAKFGLDFMKATKDFNSILFFMVFHAAGLPGLSHLLKLKGILRMTIPLHPLCLECAAKSAIADFKSNYKQRYRKSPFNHRNRPSFSLSNNIRFGADMFKKGFETGVGLQGFFVLGHRRYKCFTANDDQFFTRSGDGDIKTIGVV